MINFEFIRVSAAKAAMEARLKDTTSQFIAGGTNLIDLMKKGIVNPQKLIDISGLPLKEIHEDSGGITIGALVPNSTAADHTLIRTKIPLLSMALNAGAAAQLRNMATVGGNMMQRTRCSYFYDTTMPCNKRMPGSGCGAKEGYNRMHAIFGASDQCIAVHPSDMCVALAALNATVIVQTKKGEKKIPFTDFHRLPGDTPHVDTVLQPGELISRVFIPSGKSNRSYYLKLRDRLSYAFALVSVAVALEVKDNIILSAGIAMGGVAHKPWRLPAVEKFLAGKTISQQLLQEAASLAMEGATTYTHNAYKVKLGKAAVYEALTKAIG